MLGATIVLAAALTGAVWVETEDAGDTVRSAQPTAGDGALTQIQGTIADNMDNDIFVIRIEDPFAFSVTTNNAGTELSDTQLFLFTTEGRGLLHNDDLSTEGNRASTINSGHFDGSAGLYLLIITIYDNDPVSRTGAIFPDNFEGVATANGPGGTDRLQGFLQEPLSESGRYSIDITGASFAEEPPPPPNDKFLRGDVDASGARNISDAIFALVALFRGGAQPPCQESADTNDDGFLNLTDPIFLLNHLFLAGEQPPTPFGECAADPTPDDLTCLRYMPCE